MTEKFARVGPFELHLPIGRGGQGQVFWGRHVGRGTPVAIKVMFGESARTPQFVEGFLNEIRQVARLSHPHIILPFDCGTISAEAEGLTDGRLVCGSPYLVMEYASEGSLRARLKEGPLGWGEAQRLLVTLLRALAYSHSRRVLHRDLKPENLLICGRSERVPGLRISDFGMAGGEPGTTLASGVASGGTPPYMAPEQIRGGSAVQGPWTDLYAVGCIAFELVTGQVPFQGANWREVLAAHLEAPVPPMVPIVSTPRGLESWIRRLMEKDPHQRFLRAADALYALERLSGTLVLDDSIEPLGHGPVLSWVETWRGSIEGCEFPDDLGINDAIPSPIVPPPMPAQLGPGQHDRREMEVALAGAGLGLFEFREPELVGRDAELEILLRALEQVRSEQKARVVVLRGARGTGKSWLANRFAERADEFGLATVLSAVHSRVPSARSGIPGMLANLFRCVEEEPVNQRRLVRRYLNGLGLNDTDDHLGLMSLVEADFLGNGVPLLGPRERNAILARLIRVIGRERTPIVVLDDAHWGMDTLTLARHLVDEQPWEPVAALVVLTVDDAALESRPAVAAEIDALLASGRGQSLEITPLPPHAVRAMMDELLRLDEDLIARIEARADGNPQFVRWIMAELVRRDCLVALEQGFALRSDEQPSLPESLAGLLLERLGVVLARIGPEALPALRVAAAMGLEVDQGEWAAACAAYGCAAPPALREALVSARLAAPREGGWVFSPALFQEVVEREAISEGCWAAVHLACLEMLAARPPGGDGDERMGRHLVAAGRREEGVERLLAGALHCLAINEFLRAAELLDLASRTMDDLELGDDDLRRSRLLLARARLALGQGRLEQLGTLARQAAWQCEERGHEEALPEALRYRGIAALRSGDPVAAEAFLRWAEELASTRQLKWEQARALVHRGISRRIQHRLPEALTLLSRARALFEDLDDALGIADATLEAGSAALMAEGPSPEVLGLLELARQSYERVGNRAGEAQSLNALGECHRRLGAMTQAESCYQRAEQIEVRQGSRLQVIPRLNRAYSLLHQREFERAEGMLVANAEMARSAKLRAIEALSLLGAAWCGAVRGDWPDALERLGSAASGLRALGRRERDAAWVAEEIVILAQSLDWADIFVLARELAIEQWRGIHESERADRLAQLSGPVGVSHG